MDNSTNLLVTVYYEFDKSLIKCAVKFQARGFEYEFWRETENLRILNEYLPLHVRSCGPIVNVEQIFEVSIS